MFSDDELLPISALQHYVYCPRQCALIHIERQWVENQLTAQGRMLHERTHKEGSSKTGSRRIARGTALRSLSLGIFGQADTVEFLPPEGVPFPVEYKRGKPKPHDADQVQLCAQALCLEEMLSRPVPAGALFYGKTRRRLDVKFDAPLRQRTVQMIAELRSLLESCATPRAAYEKRKCGRCSLHKICMPEVLEGSESASRYLRRAVEAALARPPADDW